MQFKKSNILNEVAYGDFIVVPTNLGYTSKKLNVMGAGFAKTMANMHPDLAKDYGNWCYERHQLIKQTKVTQPLVFVGTQYCDQTIICIPSKHLDSKNPHLSWQADSDPRLVQESLKALTYYLDGFLEGFFMHGMGTNVPKFYIPLIGAGNGGMDQRESFDLITTYLTSYSNVVLCDPELNMRFVTSLDSKQLEVFGDNITS